jgi:O-antigen ligase
VLLVGWTLFAFAGAYDWTMVPLVCGALLLTVRERPPLVRAPTRLLDIAMIAGLVLAAATLVPLPAWLRVAIAPHTAALDQALFVGSSTGATAVVGRALSMDPGETVWAIVIALTIVLVFCSARAVIARSGLRETVRGIAWMGLALSALTVIQHATSPGLLYWYWHPEARLATPFGPFVNRNDLAAWLTMAIPVTIGYGVARFQSRRGRTAGFDLEKSLDATTLWLAASACLMLATLLVTMSRAGLTGTVVGLTCLMWVGRGRIAASAWRSLAAILIVLVTIAATYGNFALLAARVDSTIAYGLDGRREIWRLTWQIIKDFPLFGVGVGAYARAMSAYQPAPHVFYFNNAHSQYLQLLAEGGVVLALPAVIAAAATIWLIVKRLQEDRSPMFWIRAGAASGLLGVAVQATWQVVLIPAANSVLFAILAAVAMHEARPSIRPPARPQHRPAEAGRRDH